MIKDLKGGTLKNADLKRAVMNLIVTGFEGKDVDSDLRKLIKEGIGGVVLFEKNCESPQQVRDLTDRIAFTAGKSPLICVDQEGGRVQRLKKGYTRYPAPAVVGRYFEQGGDVRKVYEMAASMAVELRESGINVNFAPVVDVTSSDGNEVIGDRSFSSSALTVSELGLIYAAAFQDQGIIACAKHFPGHGTVAEDSHKSLPVCRLSWKEVQEVHLRPFVHLIENRVFSIMTAHVVYEVIDSFSPATFSRKVVMEILRRDLDFDGLVFSDDLNMGAVERWGSIGEAAVKAVDAGVDMLIVSRYECVEEVASALFDAVKKNIIPEKRLMLSSGWIDEIREEMTKNRKELPPLDLNIVKSEKHVQLVGEIEGSVTES